MKQRPFLVMLLTALGLVLFLAGGAGAQTDQELRTLIDLAGDRAANSDADLVKVFDRTDIDVEASGLSHIRNHTLTKVLSEAGCLTLGALRYDYDPATNFIEMKKLRIVRASGGIEELDGNDFVDAVQPAHAIYWGMRMKIFSLPRLEVGDAVEVETYKKGFLIAYLGQSEKTSTGNSATAPIDDDERYIPPMRTHYYDMILFEEPIPIKEKTYTVHTVKSRPLNYEVYNGECACSVTFDDEKNHYTWSKRDIPAVRPEPRAPDNWDYATKVVMATVSTWEEKSRWFDGANKDQFEANDAIRAKVAEITKDCADDDEKSTLLLRWVAANIRYSGLSMGKGEWYTLHPGWMIFEERAGVCKDIAGMLITMMRAAGIEAYPAMTMAGARVERIAADQFNHCVVARAMRDGTFKMYDPTWCPLSMDDWSLAEAEQHYVVGTPEGETLAAIEYHPPEDCLIRIDSKAVLNADGDLEGTMRFEGRGYNDTWLRRQLAGYNNRRAVRPALESWLLAVSPRAELVDLVQSDYRDLTEPVHFTMTYRIPRFGLVYGDTIVLRSPAVNVLLNQAVRAEGATHMPERTQPLFLYLAARHVVDERIALPAGYGLDHVAAARSMDNAAADLTTGVAAEDGTLRVACSMALKNRSTPPDAYAGLVDVMKNLRAFRDEPITLSR